VYHGTVEGFGAGTGSAFALLPAQNATGNWIKVVQRVPVRIALDAKELSAHPLQIGLSMQVDVDTHSRDGARLPELAANRPAYATTVYSQVDDAADRRIKAIIAANDQGGGAASADSRVADAQLRTAGLTKTTRAPHVRPL
jgi:membrane fusion protein (multidrug efflux system)